MGTGAVAAAPNYYFDYPSSPVRWDAPTSDWLWGNLTWTSGKGGVGWGENPSSDDDHLSGGTPDALQDIDNQVQDATLGFVNPPLAGPPTQPDDEFTSSPVPRDVFLNASRPVHLDLFFKNDEKGGPACTSGQTYAAGLAIEVFADGKRLAGSVGQTSFYPYWGDSYAIYHQEVYGTNPPGYAYCPYRLGVESDQILMGATLKIVIHYYQSPFLMKVGLQGDHRSVIRFPAYSAYEAAFRVPALVGSDPSGLGGDVITSDESGSSRNQFVALPSAAPLALFVGAALLARDRKGRMGTLLAAALVAAALSGCLSAGSKATSSTEVTGGDLRQTISGGAGGDLNAGTLIGLVHDDLHIPVSGAHLSIIGTASFASTDGRGSFIIAAVVPGVYTLRVDAKEFRSLESKITLEAGKTTRVDITLMPLNVKESDFRQHHHDYWGGKDMVQLMDVQLGETCSNYGCQPVSTFSVPATKPDQNPNVILPGAYDVEVIVTWDAEDMGYTNFGLKVDHNGDAPSLVGGYNRTQFYPRGSGQSFHIASNWEMDDIGHQFFSTWTFGIFAPWWEQAPHTPEEEAMDASVTGGTPRGLLKTPAATFHVKVLVHKGVLPLEPAHPELWKAGDVIDAGKLDAGLYAGALYITNDSNGGCMLTEQGVGYSWFYASLGSPKAVIPPGTKWLDVKLTASRAGTPAFDWNIAYKDGATPPVTYYYYASPGFKKVAPTSVSGLVSTWKLPVDDTLADNMYAKKSSWFFGLEAADIQAACIDFHAWTAQNPTIGAESYHFTLTIKAHRDSM